MYFFERICGSQELLHSSQHQHDLFAIEDNSYEWLRDIEMEDVEDSKEEAA